MKSPDISVIMPCYNSSRYIKEAIESILAQTYTNFEFLIINDGSTDGTHDIILQYTDPRINYIGFKKNKGNYAARNEGIKRASGKFICMMDADDIAYPNRLLTQYDYMLKHPKIGYLGCAADIIDENGNIIGAIKVPILKSRKLVTLLLKSNIMVHPSIMLRKTVFTKYGLLYDIKYKYASDYDFVGRVAKHCAIATIEDILLQYRVHDSQISRTKQLAQNYYADRIRLAYLKDFKMRFNHEQKQIYLKLMYHNTKLNQAEMEIGLDILNRMLEKNEKLKLHDKNQLFELFDLLLQRKLSIHD